MVSHRIIVRDINMLKEKMKFMRLFNDIYVEGVKVEYPGYFVIKEV